MGYDTYPNSAFYLLWTCRILFVAPEPNYKLEEQLGNFDTRFVWLFVRTHNVCVKTFAQRRTSRSILYLTSIGYKLGVAEVYTTSSIVLLVEGFM
jgi:hypothetical protein